MDSRIRFCFSAGVLILLLFCAGCTETTQTNAETLLSGGEGSGSEGSGGGSVQSAEAIAYDAAMFRNALNLGERFRYDHATGQSYDDTSSKNTVSLFVETSSDRPYYQIRNLKTGALTKCTASAGKKYYLVSVSAAHLGGYGTTVVTPHPGLFELASEGVTYKPEQVIGESIGVQIKNYLPGSESYRNADRTMTETFVFEDFGEIYVRKELYKAGKDAVMQNGWLVFEVPAGFNDVNAYLMADLTNSLPAWKLFDAQVELSVAKDPIYRTILVEFRGGPGTRTVRDITIEAALSDGSATAATLQPVIGEVAELQGTSGDDHVKVVVNLYSGKRFVYFDDIVRAKTRG